MLYVNLKRNYKSYCETHDVLLPNFSWKLIASLHSFQSLLMNSCQTFFCSCFKHFLLFSSLKPTGSQRPCLPLYRNQTTNAHNLFSSRGQDIPPVLETYTSNCLCDLSLWISMAPTNILHNYWCSWMLFISLLFLERRDCIYLSLDHPIVYNT